MARTIEWRGRTLACHERGAGDPVLLVHSSGFTSRQWRRLAEALAPTHRVLAPDLLGYGDSSPWPDGEPFELEQDVAALAGLVDGEAPVHVVGHSYGGLLGLQLALAHPDRVRSLAVYEPVAFGILHEAADADVLGSLDGVQGTYDGEPWLARFIDWWNGKGAWAAMAPEVRAGFIAVGWKAYVEVTSLSADRTDAARYGTIAVPTLLLGGEATVPAERRVLEKLCAALPDARLQLFPGLGHMGPVTHPHVVNPAILEHVRAS